MYIQSTKFEDIFYLFSCEKKNDACSGNVTCANGGTCLDYDGVRFQCKCPDGWRGPLCDEETSEFV